MTQYMVKCPYCNHDHFYGEAEEAEHVRIKWHQDFVTKYIEPVIGEVFAKFRGENDRL